MRILLFKVFNTIETWEFIERHAGFITLRNFDIMRIGELLSKRILTTPIFNNAYVMAGSHVRYNILRYKHEKYLAMIEREFIQEERFKAILDAPSLLHIYDLLRECSLIGPFLAYQYAIDFNYTPIIDFDENSFAKAGVGTIRGVQKCFSDLENWSVEDTVRYTHDNLHHYQKQYGFDDFKNLFGREPTLVDVQNCFCETDKYLRVTMPELNINRSRIKQKYLRPKDPIDYMFPPKWGLIT